MNPILPGFHPDPSICRVGSDYYLVTSTFEWFPGLPVFHSRDLVHWRSIGHALDRPDQLPLDGVAPSAGLFAPTLRHHDGTFYLLCTLVDGQTRSGNFAVTASDPAGPWSDPYWLEGDGFDPSLFFDDDGRAWFHGTRPKAKSEYDGDNEIWARELDTAAMRLVGDEYVLWDGAVKGAIWPEGPHIYKVGESYYLLSSEGGTDIDHAVVVARSDSVLGPYENNPRNPILTHRHLGRDYPITGAGHADLVQTPDGEWWMVLLAMRPYGGYFYNLGRETFLARVRWEDGWPTVEPLAVEPRAEHPAPGLPEHRWPAEPGCDHFDSAALGPAWSLLRTPREQWWSLTERPGHLRLRLRPESLADRANPSFVARRQQHMDFAAFTAMDFVPRTAHECAGLALIQNDAFHIRFVRSGDGLELVVRERGQDRVAARADAPAADRLLLGVEARGQEYSFRYAAEPGQWRALGGPVDGRLLSTPVAGGFVGASVGLYASSNGRQSDGVADFDWFEYRPV